MMFWRVARDLTRPLPTWDASSKLSLAIAAPLMPLLLALGFFGPAALQLPARIGAFGLLVAIQLLFLYANRREASPYHQAQRCFIAGDYQAARELLESTPDRGRASVDALILLGNTYRNLGDFGSSQAAIARALTLKPERHLALFSLGKLNLVQGQYGSACDCFERAIQCGAPDIARFDWGQASYLLGKRDEAARRLLDARESLAEDPAQLLLAGYYLRELDAGDAPEGGRIRENLQHWRREAAKYAATPYGLHLSQVVSDLEAELEKSEVEAI